MSYQFLKYTVNAGIATIALNRPDVYNALNDEMAEYFVRVEWLDTVDAARAVDEVGLFGNQNTVCRPTVSKWRHTVERLKAFFPNWNRP